MTRDNVSRRTVMKLAGAAGATAVVAGCSDDSGGDNGDENGNGNGGDSYDIEPDTRIVLYGDSSGWQGEEPEDIADETNPTLTLQAGESYEIGWEEGDGTEHNIEIRDDSDEVVDDLSTDRASEGGDDQFLEFEASEEMAAYVCQPHEGQMNGDLEIEGGNGGGNGDSENGDSENGNESNGGDA